MDGAEGLLGLALGLAEAPRELGRLVDHRAAGGERRRAALAATLLGRAVNRAGPLPAVIVTAASMAVGAGVQKPVVRGGEVKVATVMSVTLSVDHRVIDGALGAQLLAAIKDNLENPMVMLA